MLMRSLRWYKIRSGEVSRYSWWQRVSIQKWENWPLEKKITHLFVLLLFYVLHWQRKHGVECLEKWNWVNWTSTHGAYCVSHILLSAVEEKKDERQIYYPWTGFKLLGDMWPTLGASQVVLVVKNLPVMQVDIWDMGLIPGLGRSPGEGKGYSLQCSGLENSMDCIVHGVTKSQTWLSDFHFTSC